MARPMPQLDGVAHHMVRVGDVRLHVAEAGAGEPLLLIHGWPENWYAWRHLIGPLSERYRVLCPDLRGFGWSEAPAGGYGKDALAGDISGLLDVLGLERVRLVGHDWGAFVAFLVALRSPERVERLVMASFPHPWGKRAPRALVAGWRLLYQPVMGAPVAGPRLMANRAAMARFMQATATRKDALTESDLDVLLGQFDDPARAAAASRLFRTFVLRELPTWMTGRFDRERLTVPTLLLAGEHDMAFASAWRGGFEEHTDDMRIELVPDAGHWLAHEQPEGMLERMLAFL